MMQKDRHEMARRRWKMLARALRKSKEEQHDRTVSVRRITGFGLVVMRPLGVEAQAQTPWFEYRTEIGGRWFAVTVRHLVREITAVDLMGFNNTGNVCVWPSEEVLAYHALCNQHAFDGKRVLELGGGMTCLAGLLVAKHTRAALVHLTDGNKASVENVRAVVRRNELDADVGSRVKCSVLDWGDCRNNGLPSATYDVILAADCLFFDEARKDLVTTMWRCLEEDGVALVTAPRRGLTLDEFVAEASRVGFVCRPTEKYNEQVWDRHLELKAKSAEYDEDIHYPILIKLTKTNNNHISAVDAVTTTLYNL